MAETVEFVKIEWYPSDKPNKVRVLIDNPLKKILPESMAHKVLRFLTNQSMLDRLISGEAPEPVFTPSNISEGISIKNKIFLYPLLEKLWINGVLDKDWSWMDYPWWFATFGTNSLTIEVVKCLNEGKIYHF